MVQRPKIKDLLVILKRDLCYNGRNFIWTKKNRKCGTIDNRGRRLIKIEGFGYTEEQLVWLLYHGKFAKRILHINDDKTDNSLKNLKEIIPLKYLTKETNWHKNHKELYRLLHERFYYEDGFLYHNECSAYYKRRVYQNINANGYYEIFVGERMLRVHRLIFLMQHGYLPKLIDHKDRNPLNNRIENLRDSTHSLNTTNSKVGHNNNSGYRGVCKTTEGNRWRAYICKDGKNKHIGSYLTIEDAFEARKKAEKEAWGTLISCNNDI